MSINLKSAVDNNSKFAKEIQLSSFSGGQTIGRCIQVSTQRAGTVGVSIQMTEEQVRQSVEVMQAWLNGEYIEE